MARIQNSVSLTWALAAVASLLLVSQHCSMATAQSYGVATYYTPPYVPSACYGNSNHGVMIAAASEELWNGGEACGSTYQVSCVSGTNKGSPQPCTGGGSVTVKIVDFCPRGCRGTIDLSQEAFAMIADTDAGVINIAYQRI